MKHNFRTAFSTESLHRFARLLFKRFKTLLDATMGRFMLKGHFFPTLLGSWHAPRYEQCILLTCDYVLRARTRTSEFLASSSSIFHPRSVSSLFCDSPWVKLSIHFCSSSSSSYFPSPFCTARCARRIDFDGIRNLRTCTRRTSSSSSLPATRLCNFADDGQSEGRDAARAVR